MSLQPSSVTVRPVAKGGNSDKVVEIQLTKSPIKYNIQ